MRSGSGGGLVAAKRNGGKASMKRKSCSLEGEKALLNIEATNSDVKTKRATMKPMPIQRAAIISANSVSFPSATNAACHTSNASLRGHTRHVCKRTSAVSRDLRESIDELYLVISKAHSTFCISLQKNVNRHL